MQNVANANVFDNLPYYELEHAEVHNAQRVITMILKDRDPREHPAQDKLSLAGAKAESQMAFYLRREFGKDSNILVINDLRLKDDTGEIAQIDHLVIHPYGLAIIESKSVTSEVRINKQEEWVRLWNGKEIGMASPVQQAKRQARFLKTNLIDHAEQLLEKVLAGMLQKQFGICPFDVFIAISDCGIVHREIPVEEVVKADQVTEKLLAKMSLYKKNANLFNPMTAFSSAGCWDMTKEESGRVAQFLLSCHCPLVYPANTVKPPIPPPLPASSESMYPDWKYKPKIQAGFDICGKCKSVMFITWGKYGYYWKCRKCDTNTPIKESCSVCVKKMLIHKRGKQYFVKCESCETERMYYQEG